MEKITIVSPKIKGYSGTASYVENVLKGLNLKKIDYDVNFLKKREISLFGKPFFGIFYQIIAAKFLNVSTPVVHALSPEVVVKNTNVVTIHDIIPFTNPEIYIKNLYDKIAYNLAFRKALEVPNMLVSTKYGKAQLSTHLDIDPQKIHVVNHCIDHSKFYPDPVSPYEDNTINIVMVSDFNPRKRIDLIVKAIGGQENLSFYHIGPTQKWESVFSNIVNISKKFNNVHLLGPKDSMATRRYVSNSDLFIYLSEEEGFGYPILEAMACGTNVLVSKIPVFEELFSGIASFTDHESFSIDSIMLALKNRKPKTDIINYSKKFSIEKMATELVELYNEILN